MQPAQQADALQEQRLVKCGTALQPVSVATIASSMIRGNGLSLNCDILPDHLHKYEPTTHATFPYTVQVSHAGLHALHQAASTPWQALSRYRHMVRLQVTMSPAAFEVICEGARPWAMPHVARHFVGFQQL